MENKIEESKIQESTRRNWADMPYDILTNIFAFLCMTDVVFNVSAVCGSWRKASADPIIWETLDLELFVRKFRVHPNYKVWVSRSPNLKLLVLPTCPRISEEGLASALRQWPKLEMLSISVLYYTNLVLQDIGKICKNITAIKLVNGLVNKDSALAIINFLPGLKVITLRCRNVEKEAVEILLDNLQNLEQLYISDRFHPPYFAFDRTPHPIENEDIIKKASKLQNFHICQNGYCRKCPTALDNISVIKASF